MSIWPRAKIKIRHGLVFTMSICCHAAMLGHQTDAGAIVRQSIEAMASDWNQAPYYSYIERDLEQSRSKPAASKSYQILMIDGSPYHKLIAVGDAPLAPEQRAAEDRNMQRETRKRERESAKEHHERVSAYEKKRAREQNLIREMSKAFDFTIAGEEDVNGRNCWILAAKPRPGYVPPDRDSRVLTGMTGRLWIDREQYRWVRSVAEVIQPVSFFGFLAKVDPGTRFVFEQAPLKDDLWFPTHLSIEVNSSVLGILPQNSRQDEMYSDYKPLADPGRGNTAAY